MRRSLFILVLAGCAEPASGSAGGSPRIDGRLIHPACVYELRVSLADTRPIATSVDIEGCERGNRYAGGVVSPLRGGLEYRDAALFGDGFFAYWPVGRTSGGIHVLHTVENGGGSGVFHRLLFVVLERAAFLEDGKVARRWILRRVGEEGLGDRASDEAGVEGDTVVIRSRDGSRREIPLGGL